MNVLIITGLSGAGKSLALRKMEDNSYFCVDNLPVNMAQELIDSMSGESGVENIALGIDSRSISLKNIEQMLQSLREKNNRVEVLFLDARDDVLVRRYSETRRNHPMARQGFIEDGIALERQALKQLRGIATYYIDTSEKKPAELTREMDDLMNLTKKDMAIFVRSFGYKYGIPADADIMMDMRFIPNPFWVEDLRFMTGKDQPVIDFVMNHKQSREFLSDFPKTIHKLIPGYLREGKTRLMIAIGCTGGQHRSVCLADAMGKNLLELGVENEVSHRDLEKADVR